MDLEENGFSLRLFHHPASGATALRCVISDCFVVVLGLCKI
jgi:hypothetical protein